VTLHAYYEQAELVRQATWTIKKALVQGAVLVVATLLIFLGNLRSAFIVALSLPLCASFPSFSCAYTAFPPIS
jgi:cobalt-zinc-cadmium resistance protein CzcA